MKPKNLFMTICIVCAVCVAGCERYERHMECVIWENDSSYDLDITIFLQDSDMWNFALPRTTRQTIYEGRTYYTSSRSNGNGDFLPSAASWTPVDHYNWRCRSGYIDSVHIKDAKLDTMLLTATRIPPVLCNPDIYEKRYQSDKRIFLLSITDSLLKETYSQYIEN